MKGKDDNKMIYEVKMIYDKKLIKLFVPAFTWEVIMNKTKGELILGISPTPHWVCAQRYNRNRARKK